MNIIEAINMMPRNKCFKRPGLEWLYISSAGAILQTTNDRSFTFLSGDILADDWIVEEDE